MKKKNYVNNKDLYDSIVAYNKQKEELGVDNVRIPNYIGECIMLIGKRLASKGNFAGYSYKDEMISDGVENCLGAVDYFDTERTKNPFAYFTQIMWYAFLRRIQKEKRQHYLKLKNFKKQIAHEELLNPIPTLYSPSAAANTESIDQFIHDYESKSNERKPKKNKKEKGVEKFYEEDKDE